MGKSLAELKTERGITGPPLLHGSDVPDKKKSFKVTVKLIRESPENFRSPAIMEFESPVFERDAMALNITNLRRIAILVGLVDQSDAEIDSKIEIEQLSKMAAGKTLTISVISVNNPQLQQNTPSLFF